MAVLGVSGGCWYPLPAAEAPLRVAAAGAGCTEFFVCTSSETSESFAREYRRICDGCGVRVVSLHPHTSFAETFLFFSGYRSRFEDSLSLYDRYFEVCNIIGAKVVNFHGAKLPNDVSVQRYAEVYHTLFRRAERAGVIFAQENVRQHCSGGLDFLLELSRILRNEVRFTFDVKQANAEHLDVDRYIMNLAKKTALVHICDVTPKDFCLVPFNGSFDFARFFSKMKENGYDGTYMLEVYSSCFKDDSEIGNAVSGLKKIMGGN